MSDGTLRDFMEKARKRQSSRRSLPRAKSELEETLWTQLQLAGLGARCVRNFRFAAPQRKWEFDFAFLHKNLAIECDGGTWRQSGKGAHTGGTAQARDMEKHNAAVERGWRVLRYDLKAIKSGAALSQILRVLSQRKIY